MNYLASRNGGSDAEVDGGTGCPCRRVHSGCDACCAVPAIPAGMVSRACLSDARQTQHGHLRCPSPRNGEKGLRCGPDRAALLVGMLGEIVIHGPRFLLGNGASLTSRKCRIVSCRLSPNADVGQTGKHFPRTATAASRMHSTSPLAARWSPLSSGGRSVPTELIMNRSVTDDRAVPSGTVQHFAK